MAGKWPQPGDVCCVSVCLCMHTDASTAAQACLSSLLFMIFSSFGVSMQSNYIQVDAGAQGAPTKCASVRMHRNVCL